MSLQEFLNLINYRKKTVILITAVILVVASLFTFLQPLKYSARSRILIINYGTDTYSLTKSSEYVANILTQAAYSDYFYQNLKSSYAENGIDWSYFRGDNQKQLKKWESTIEIKPSIDSEFIQVTIYHPDKAQAAKIAWAVNDTLVTRHQTYHGLGDRIKLKVIDNSLISNFPAKPNIILNLGVGLILGLVLALIYIYLFPEKSFIGQRVFNKLKVRQQDQYLDLAEPGCIGSPETELLPAEPEMSEPLPAENAEFIEEPLTEDPTMDLEQGLPSEGKPEAVANDPEQRFYQIYDEKK